MLVVEVFVLGGKLRTGVSRRSVVESLIGYWMLWERFFHKEKLGISRERHS
jgi:hypothetical protein